MSYELLRSLYFGEGTNADLTSRAARERLHVRTPLEDLVPSAIAGGLDVVLTGNPGDGKSHVARTLAERGVLHGAELVADLSERSTADVVELWRSCRTGGRRVLLCGNEGPLVELIEALRSQASIGSVADELHDQVGRLVSDDRAQLPPEPKVAMLIDLADRSVLDSALIAELLRRVSTEEFLPALGQIAIETSAGRNILMLQAPEVRDRLARILSLAGRRAEDHVTFRQLWAAVAFAISGAKSVNTLRAELSRSEDGLPPSLLDHLVNPRAQGPLIAAVREHADPATVPSPDLDEQLWSLGRPDSGEWLYDAPVMEAPGTLWSKGLRDEALARHERLKRLVALAHERGAALITELESRSSLPSATDDQSLLSEIVTGLRRTYLTAQAEAESPTWLREGIPLWLGFSYENTAIEQRPHVAARALPTQQFTLQRPVRPPWLGAALGPPPEIAWLAHRDLGVSLRVGPTLLSQLRRAAQTAGPISVPDAVTRFLARLSGHAERTPDASDSGEFAIIDRPRGHLVAAERVLRGAEGASYARTAQG